MVLGMSSRRRWGYSVRVNASAVISITSSIDATAPVRSARDGVVFLRALVHDLSPTVAYLRTHIWLSRAIGLQSTTVTSSSPWLQPYILALCPYLRTSCTSFPFGDDLQNIRTTYWRSVTQMVIQISRIEYQGLRPRCRIAQIVRSSSHVFDLFFVLTSQPLGPPEYRSVFNARSCEWYRPETLLACQPRLTLCD